MTTQTVDTDDLIADFALRGVEGARQWVPGDIAGGLFGTGVYYLGRGTAPLEVCVVTAPQKPRTNKDRQPGGASGFRIAHSSVHGAAGSRSSMLWMIWNLAWFSKR
jgi:hypothetical protein